MGPYLTWPQPLRSPNDLANADLAKPQQASFPQPIEQARPHVRGRTARWKSAKDLNSVARAGISVGQVCSDLSAKLTPRPEISG